MKTKLNKGYKPGDDSKLFDYPGRNKLDWEKKFDENFPELSVIEGQGEEGSIHGFNATDYVKLFIKSILIKQKEEILGLECLKEEKPNNTLVGTALGNIVKENKNYIRNQIKEAINNLDTKNE